MGFEKVDVLPQSLFYFKICDIIITNRSETIKGKCL